LLPGVVGTLEGEFRVAREGCAAGCLSYGPYVALPAGSYRLVLELADVTGPSDAPVAAWDVGYFHREPITALGRGDVLPGATQVEVLLPIWTDECRPLEVRLHYRGRGTVTLRRLTIDTLPPGTFHTPPPHSPCGSCPCTQAQLESPAFRWWARRMGVSYKMHRKVWELCYVAQVLYEHGMLAPGKRGLGFAVGQEPLPALFASFGCEVVATDLHPKKSDAVWIETNQHATNIEGLQRPAVCDPNVFRQRATFRFVDMNDIPADLTDFDFVWSCCSFEHLGSLQKGKRFIRRMTRCLKPGGVAVHTTEFNVSSNTRTIGKGRTVLFRRRDFDEMIAALRQAGHEVAEIDYHTGDGPADLSIDRPPYQGKVHLKVEVGGYTATSIGLITRVRRDNGSGKDADLTSSSPAHRHPPVSTFLRSCLKQTVRVLGLLPLAHRLQARVQEFKIDVRRGLFRLTRGNLSKPCLVQLPEFKIYVRPDDFIGSWIAIAKSYEPHVTQGLRRYLKPGVCFLDIGANIGYFTLLAAALVGKRGRVLAFEPRPDNCALLRKSLDKNRFRNVRLYPHAAAEKEQTFELYPDGTNSTGVLVDEQWRQPVPPGQPYVVRAVVLDDCLAGLDKLDVVKIDIDGAEVRAVQGMEGLIQRHRPVIFTELCPVLLRDVSHSTPEAYLEQLLGYGYTLGIVEESEGGAAVPRCKQEILEAYYCREVTLLDLVAWPR
jgi:FkbM family methyltransferase